jgi:hypothetical protein
MKQFYSDCGRGKLKIAERNLTYCDTVHYKSHITGFGSNSTLHGKGIHRICTGARVRVWTAFKVLRVISDVVHL